MLISACNEDRCGNEDFYRKGFTVELPAIPDNIDGCSIGENPAEHMFAVNQDIYQVFHCDGIITPLNHKWGAEMHISGICRDYDPFSESWSLPEQNGFECSGIDGYREMEAFESDGVFFRACADPVYLASNDSDFNVIFQLRSPARSNCEEIIFDNYHFLFRVDAEFQRILWNREGSCFSPIHSMLDDWFVYIGES